MATGKDDVWAGYVDRDDLRAIVAEAMAKTVALPIVPQFCAPRGLRRRSRMRCTWPVWHAIGTVCAGSHACAPAVDRPVSELAVVSLEGHHTAESAAAGSAVERGARGQRLDHDTHAPRACADGRQYQIRQGRCICRACCDAVWPDAYARVRGQGLASRVGARVVHNLLLPLTGDA